MAGGAPRSEALLQPACVAGRRLSSDRCGMPASESHCERCSEDRCRRFPRRDQGRCSRIPILEAGGHGRVRTTATKVRSAIRVKSGDEPDCRSGVTSTFPTVGSLVRVTACHNTHQSRVADESLSEGAFRHHLHGYGTFRRLPARPPSSVYSRISDRCPDAALRDRMTFRMCSVSCTAVLRPFILSEAFHAAMETLRKHLVPDSHQ